ncbi:hypothetical protein KSS87_019248, partial [Heliosperma pusillum]
MDHEEGEIPMPISSAYVGVFHEAPSNNIFNNGIEEQQHLQVQGYNGNFSEVKKSNNKVVIKYRECQKNHAATMGGNALDGCGEFMPSGEEGSIEALICCACNCHRNFHRKEIEGGENNCQFYPSTPHSTLMGGRGRKVILGSGNVIPFTRSLPINMGYNNNNHHDDGYGFVHGNGGVMVMKHNNNNINNNQGFNQGFNQ